MDLLEGLEAQIATLCQELIPLKKRLPLIEAAKQLPKIVNVVATANFLPPGYTLPLKSIACSVACAQYAPRMFAACIVRFTGSISACTALLFSTGCVVIVSLRSKEHARHMSQMLRVILEAACPRYARRLCFERCEIHNIVGNADLGYPIDLRAMSEAAPACCKWFPELFPGLECKIWLTENYRCECGKGRRNTLSQLLPGVGAQRKCSCVVKLLIFDTGRLVITGARRLADVNAVFFRIKVLMEEFKTNDRQFYTQLGSMLTAAPTEKTVPRTELKPDVAVACVLAGMNPMFTKKDVGGGGEGGVVVDNSLPPFMKMALAGRVDVVKTLFLMDPSAAEERDGSGRTTLERLSQIPDKSAEHTKIIEMLNEVKGP